MTWMLLLSLAQAGSLTCQSAEEAPAVVYQSWGKSGGAHPGPDTPMSTETWTVDGKKLYEMVKKYQGAPEKTGDLDWEWLVDRTTDVEVLVRSRIMNRVRYKTEVRLFRPSGAELPNGHGVSWTVPVTCVREDLYGIP